MSENFAFQQLKCAKGFLTCRNILRHEASGFTSHPKDVLQIIIAVKNPRPLGPVASTLTTTPPRRLYISHTVRTMETVTLDQACTNLKNEREYA
jgi:hypothetical protein